MSSLEIPATRTLTRVLRSQLAQIGDPVQLLVGIGATPPAGASANAYVNVVLGGKTIQVAKLRGAPQPAVGGPAYLLASTDFLLYLGTVSLAALLAADEPDAEKGP